jgi:hypothetical protein
MVRANHILSPVALGLAVILILGGSVSAGTIYEYKDEKGNLVLTNQPPSDRKKARPIESYREMTPVERTNIDTEKQQKAEEEETRRFTAEEKARKQAELEKKKEEEQRRQQEAAGPPPPEYSKKVDEYLRAKGYSRNPDTNRFEKNAEGETGR